MADTQTQTQSRMANISARSGQRAIQHEAVTRHQMQMNYPNWPTSKPGPLAKQPSLGQRPINLLRREQMVEVG